MGLTTAVEFFPLKNYLSSPFNESSSAPEPICDHSVFSKKSKWQGSNEVRQMDNADPLIFMCNDNDLNWKADKYKYFFQLGMMYKLKLSFMLTLHFLAEWVGGGGGGGVSLLGESLSYVKIIAFWVG